MRTTRMIALGLSASLLALSCSSDEGGADPCSAFCSAFAHGKNCGDVLASCPTDCKSLSLSCPARADALFNCLGKLDYSCHAPGQASANGDSRGDVAIYANSGTLYVSDSECAKLYNEYISCGAGGDGGAAGAGGAGGSAGSSQGGSGNGGGDDRGGAGGTGAAGGTAGNGAGGSSGGGSSGGGAPDLGNVTFSLSYTTTPADPNGEGGERVPYLVRVCIDPAEENFIRVDNIGSASAGSFATAIVWVKDYPDYETVIGACTAFTSTPPLASGYNVSWRNAHCCDFNDTFSTFDQNPRRIVVYADALEQVTESDEANNSASSEAFEP